MIENYTYLLVNFFIILFPLVFSFESKLTFYKQWKRLLLAALPISLFFIGWDMVATSRGHWGFNPEFTTGWQIFNLPVEEVLFFFTVPYSCLFIYQLTSYVICHPTSLKLRRTHKSSVVEQGSRQEDSAKSFYILVFIAVLITVYYLLMGKEYSGFVLLVSLIVSLILYRNGFFQSRTFWSWMGVCLVLFFVTNTVLTGLPVVVYGSQFITNFRIGTIPIEDFFYNWSLLGLYMWRWKAVKQLN